MGFGRNVNAVADAEKVGRAAFVDVLFLLCIQIQHARISFFMPDLGRSQARRVVPAGLHVPRSERSGRDRGRGRSTP